MLFSQRALRIGIAFTKSTIMLNRLIYNWVYGGFLAGLLLVALSPLIISHWPAALTTTFFCLPAYMLHQYEEHDKDRFRIFVNRMLGNGREVLTRRAVFLINVLGARSFMWFRQALHEVTVRDSSPRRSCFCHLVAGAWSFFITKDRTRPQCTLSA